MSGGGSGGSGTQQYNWNDTMKPYWDEWAKSRGPMVVEALGKVRAALGR